jgi:hypothetical protein
VLLDRRRRGFPRLLEVSVYPSRHRPHLVLLDRRRRGFPRVLEAGTTQHGSHRRKNVGLRAVVPADLHRQTDQSRAQHRPTMAGRVLGLGVPSLPSRTFALAPLNALHHVQTWQNPRKLMAARLDGGERTQMLPTAISGRLILHVSRALFSIGQTVSHSLM